MAVRGGFEPPMQFPTYTLSRRAPSTTRTSHRLCINITHVAITLMMQLCNNQLELFVETF